MNHNEKPMILQDDGEGDRREGIQKPARYKHT